jgi:hypothetical protein
MLPPLSSRLGGRFRYFRKHASAALTILTPLVWVSLKLRLLFKLAPLGVKPSSSLKTAERTVDNGH